MIRPFAITISRRFFHVALLIGLALVGPVNFDILQAAQQSTIEPADAEQQYEKALTQGRELAKQCRRISVKFFDSSLANSYEWKEKWPAAAKALADHRPILEKASLDWFFVCQKPSEELLQLASAISAQAYDSGDMELTWKILTRVKQFYSNPDDIMLNRRLALVAIKSNRYDFAMEFLQMPGAKDAVEQFEDQLDKNMFLFCGLKAKQWIEEAEIRGPRSGRKKQKLMICRG